jgi:hypothetical protein
LLSFEVGGGEVSCGVGGLGVRTATDWLVGSCDDGGGVIEVERDLSPGVSGCASSVVGSSGVSMVPKYTKSNGVVQGCG